MDTIGESKNSTRSSYLVIKKESILLSLDEAVAVMQLLTLLAEIELIYARTACRSVDMPLFLRLQARARGCL
ncbi:hypothetical protein [Mucilaginibacter defluvii]|uniref:hypothetical protein n=1 Tax=Mucilaginibacter defluvii TaxID=1196019 RepID=UPI0031E630BD